MNFPLNNPLEKIFITHPEMKGMWQAYIALVFAYRALQYEYAGKFYRGATLLKEERDVYYKTKENLLHARKVFEQGCRSKGIRPMPLSFDAIVHLYAGV